MKTSLLYFLVQSPLVFDCKKPEMAAVECCELVHVKPNGSDGTSYSVNKDSVLILGRWDYFVLMVEEMRSPNCSFHRYPILLLTKQACRL